MDKQCSVCGGSGKLGTQWCRVCYGTESDKPATEDINKPTRDSLDRAHRNGAELRHLHHQISELTEKIELLKFIYIVACDGNVPRDLIASALALLERCNFVPDEQWLKENGFTVRPDKTPAKSPE